MEVIVKLGKTNTMTNTRGKTKTKTDNDKKVESKRIPVLSKNHDFEIIWIDTPQEQL